MTRGIPRGLSVAGLVVVAGLSAGPLGAERAEVAWAASDVVTSFSFNESLLEALGLVIRGLEPSADPLQRHPLDVGLRGTPAFRAPAPHAIAFTVDQRAVDQFVGGTLRHLGGFTVAWRGGSVSLVDFELRPGEGTRELEILDRDGWVVFTADHMHFELDPEARRLSVFNLDLRIAPALARWMGRPEVEGQVVGTLAFDATVELPPNARGTEGSCPDNWAGTVDVALIDIGSVGQADRGGGLVVVVPSATLKNVGTADVPWYSKFTGSFPPYGNDQHPFLVWGMFRTEPTGHGTATRFRQLGTSSVKHAFLTLNNNCTGCGFDGHILGLGCEDVYGQSTNTSNNSLAPREEIKPHQGIWAHCDEPVPNTPSHFDQDGNCVQDHFGAGEDDFSHGMAVSETELADPSSTYHVEAWYVVRDDVDIFNTMGYRPVTPTFGSIWTFPHGAFGNGPALNTWVDPTNPQPGELNTHLRLAAGQLRLATRVVDVGNGAWRYEYALQSFDYEVPVAGFAVPFLEPTILTDVTFFDPDQVNGNDWVASSDGAGVVWTVAAGQESNTLRWGSLMSFGFTTEAAPVAAQAMISPDGATPFTAAILAPGESSLIFLDGFESGGTTAWSSSIGEAGPWEPRP